MQVYRAKPKVVLTWAPHDQTFAPMLMVLYWMKPAWGGRICVHPEGKYELNEHLQTLPLLTTRL
jgi:hypothetical protein